MENNQYYHKDFERIALPYSILIKKSKYQVKFCFFVKYEDEDLNIA